MLGLGGAMEPLAGGRSWPDSPGEALAILIGIVCAWAIGAGVVVLVGWFLSWWCFSNRPKALRRRLEKESAEFRERWPLEQLGYAPYVELSKEAQRCWALIFILEESDDSTEYSSGAGASSSDFVALRSWVDVIVMAMNSAADRDQQAAVGRYSR
ncbi:hypothetical protein H7H51_14470 [Mycolicibacterium farcinogenes]|nr:hypothetical protein [Mycolicibacterium farcinogenes]